MANKPRLLLRRGRNRVKLIHVNTTFRPRIVFGTIQGAGEGTRADSLDEHASGETRSEAAIRPKDATSIKLALPTREQTALFFEVGPETQAKLRGMGDDGSNGRQEIAPESVDPRCQRGAEMAADAESRRARASQGAGDAESNSGDGAEALRAKHGKIDT